MTPLPRGSCGKDPAGRVTASRAGVSLACAVSLALLCLPGAALPAAAQSPSLTLQATPSPFGPGATVGINAEVTRQGWFECPYEAPPWVGCAVLSMFSQKAWRLIASEKLRGFEFEVAHLV
jgi:hypothetical protein